MPRIIGSWDFKGNRDPATHMIRSDFLDMGWSGWIERYAAPMFFDRGFDLCIHQPFGLKDQRAAFDYLAYDRALRSGHSGLRRWALDFADAWAKALDRYKVEVIGYAGAVRHDLYIQNRKSIPSGFDNVFGAIERAIKPYANAGMSYADDAIGVAELGSVEEGIALTKHAMYSENNNDLARYYIEPMPVAESPLVACNVIAVDRFWRAMETQQRVISERLADAKTYEEAAAVRPHWAAPLSSIRGEVIRLVLGDALDGFPNHAADNALYNAQMIGMAETILGDGHSMMVSFHGLTDKTLGVLAEMNAELSK